MNNKIRPLALSLALLIPLGIGGLSAILTGDMMKEYFFLNKPPLSPPGWVFPIVWTILYVMMGIASYTVATSGKPAYEVRRALICYGIQLALNFLWPILFFNGSLFLLAFFELVALIAMTLITTVLFFKISRTAGMLMIPYVAWMCFAAYLNLAVYKLSITPMPLPRTF